MAIHLKNEEDLEKMRIAGRLTSQVLDMIEPYVLPGVTTQALDERCHKFIVDELSAIPAPLNYRGFPKSICTSVNHVVCHGIPGEKKLKNGDIINIDITVIKDGFHAADVRGWRSFRTPNPFLVAQNGPIYFWCPKQDPHY